MRRVPLVLLSAAATAGACGRSSLDAPVDTTGAVATLGVAGTFGAAGTAGTSGTMGTAGTASATCVEGTDTCAGPQTGEICSGGIFHTFNCPMGCFDGVCAECVPSSTSCATENTMQVCGPNGIWQPPHTCDALCINGACGSCLEGATRCSSPAGQQTCKGGRWTAATACEFVCVGDTCGKKVRNVFVTSQAFAGGELGGLTGADDICRKLAVSAGLSSSYAAWLSDDTGSPVSRFPVDVGPYVLVDGTLVANNWTDLTSGMLRHAIDRNERGGPPALSPDSITPAAVWTDTSASGTLSTISPAGGSCSDWSDPMATTIVFGSFQFVSGDWSELGSEGSGAGAPPICGISAALYCFEQ
jgi:hypothetical protein